MEGKGYWAKDGNLYELGSKKHIDLIIEDPERFGLTDEIIHQTYQKYHEKIHFEGKAREELIIKALKPGWIRIRHYMRKRDYWSIQFYDYNRCKGQLVVIFRELLDSGNMYSDDALVLSDFFIGTKKEYNSLDGGVEAFCKRCLLITEEHY